MKKLLLLTLPLLILSGCSLTGDKTTISLPLIDNTITTDTTNTWIETIVALFDPSKIEFIIDDTVMESYYVYKNIKPYGNWYIWVRIWGNEGISSDIVYIENDKIIKELNDVFWYNYYKDQKIHEFCWGDLDTCPIAKETSCIIDNDKNQSCTYSFFEYMFNLINWEENNSYFSQKLQAFEKSL